jgi:serine/threonine protein kinase
MVSVSYLATGVSVADGSDLDSTAVSESVSQSAFDYRPGETVGGDYRLVQLLGRGGMGTVFAAEHRYIKGKQYALKLLSREQVTDDNLKRFQREAVALARLSHPGIVQIYNFGIDKDVCPYYVMEIVDGISLADLIKQSGPFR